PRISDWVKDVDQRVNFGIEFGKTRKFIKDRDVVVVITGWKQGSGFTNTMRIVYVTPPVPIPPPPPTHMELLRKARMRKLQMDAGNVMLLKEGPKGIHRVPSSIPSSLPSMPSTRRMHRRGLSLTRTKPKGMVGRGSPRSVTPRSVTPRSVTFRDF
ncbi:hypothetical protein J6590_062494, partial [Homalodisca vitripennis]